MDRSADQPGAFQPKPCIDRTRAWIGLVVIVLLVVLLASDLAALRKHPIRFPATGNDYMALLAKQKYSQVVNFIIGAALHDGVGTVRTVFVPQNLASLSARPTDRMIEGVQPAFQIRFLTQLVGGDLKAAAYDPVVSAQTIAGWTISGRLKTYPKQVFLLRPASSRAASGNWVLLTDPTRLKVFIVPAEEAPTGVTLP